MKDGQHFLFYFSGSSLKKNPNFLGIHLQLAYIPRIRGTAISFTMTKTLLRFHWNHMNVQMKNNLPSGLPIILHNSDTFSIYGIPDSKRNPLNNLKKISSLILRNLINVRVVFFWNHKSVPLINWAIAQKGHDLLILVDYACGQLLLNYLAEYAFRHRVIPFSCLFGGIYL